MINFPFGTNGKSIILGVPILKHIIAVPQFLLPAETAVSDEKLPAETVRVISLPAETCCV